MYAHCSVKLHLEEELKERRNIRKIRFLAYDLESLTLPTLNLKNFGRKTFISKALK